MTPAQTIITAFGGIRPLARVLGRAPSTVKNWKDKGFIPGEMIAPILDAAKERGIKLTLNDVIYGRPRRG